MKKFLLYFFGFILLMQLIRPTKNKSDIVSNSRIAATHPIPEKVDAILKRACNDCHTNNTNYLWYHDIAPISWVIALDVYSGKTHLNLDEWDKYNVYQKTTLYSNFNKSITSGKMPTGIYLTYHPEAILSKEEQKELTDWFTSIVNIETALE